MKVKNEKIKLHLGCGSNILPGYINVDKYNREDVNYDINANILDLKFDDNLIDEIRLHHVFEHFHKYQAVVLIFVWNNWLKKDGKLIIETPDFEWCCREYLNLMTPLSVVRNVGVWIKHRKNYFKPNKWLTLRHIFGSKEAKWAYHLEGWDKFTLSYLYKLFGFEIIDIKQQKYRGGPMPNIAVTGKKQKHINPEEFEYLSKKFLRKTVASNLELSVCMREALELKDRFVNRKNFTSEVKNFYAK